MVPAMMEELLFDDILCGDSAREEHARFRRVLQYLNIQVVEAQDLLAETLALSEARTWVLDHVARPGNEALHRELLELSPDRLAEALVSGVLDGGGQGLDGLFPVLPLPNWCFQRDPQVVIGDGVAFCAMSTRTRWHEAIVSRVVFKYHPRLRAAPIIHDPYADQDPAAGFEALRGAHLEGGDVLVLSGDVIAVGRSERTTWQGIENLAASLSRRETGPRWLVAVELPRQRAYMHLDTLLTPLDHDTCLVHAPVVLPGGPESAATFTFDLHASAPEPRESGPPLDAFRRLGLDYRPITCGGDDPIAQQREQWTDGANSLAVAPGVVFLYKRNIRTAEELLRNGFRVAGAEDILLGREEIDLSEGKRICILLASHEIARARGGPHCLTHPLVRDEPV
jgi:arginine deiminase